MTIVMTRDALMEKLSDVLKTAKAEDERAAKLHEQEEQKALVKFRFKLKAAMTWDYKTTKEKSYRWLQLDQPTCPRRHAAKIERVIRDLKNDTRSKHTLHPTSDAYAAINWAPESKRIKDSICED